MILPERHPNSIILVLAEWLRTGPPPQKTAPAEIFSRKEDEQEPIECPS